MNHHISSFFQKLQAEYFKIMTETVRYLETRLVAPHPPPGFNKTNKNNAFFYVLELGHMLVPKNPPPIKHTDSYENYVEKLYSLYPPHRMLVENEGL